MMGPRQVAQGALFYEFSIEDHVPPDHLLRCIDQFVDLGDMRRHLVPFYSSTGRPEESQRIVKALERRLRQLIAAGGTIASDQVFHSLAPDR